MANVEIWKGLALVAKDVVDRTAAFGLFAGGEANFETVDSQSHH